MTPPPFRPVRDERVPATRKTNVCNHGLRLCCNSMRISPENVTKTTVKVTGRKFSIGNG
jgi:hypothetical protein